MKRGLIVCERGRLGGEWHKRKKEIGTTVIE